VTLVAVGGGAWWSTRMTAGRGELMALLKRFDGRQIPDTSQDRMTDYEAMRIHVYHDAQVADRVARRYQTYGVNPGSQNSQSGSSQGAVQGATADQDPLVTGKASEVYYQAVTKNRITLDVLQRVLGSLSMMKGRKSMILVSEGFIYDPNMDEFKDVKEASRRANVAVYYLDTRGLQGASIYATAQFGPPLPDQDVGAAFTENLEASEGSESIAADTGGFTVKNTNDLGKGIKKIADETRAYYLLGYNPTNTARDGKFRTIKVRVAGKNYEVRARKGYYAPSPDGTRTAADRAKKKGVDTALQSALDAPWDQPEIPIRMMDHVLEESMLGKATVLLSADVDMSGFGFAEKEGRFHDTMEFMLVVAHRETGEFFRYDQKYDMKLLPESRERYRKQWFSVTKDFELGPGGYQAKLVVRDKNSGVVGSVVHNFVVPELNQFRTSSPVITDSVQIPKDALDNRPKPQIVARRTFKPEGMLYCSFEVFGADKDKKTGLPRVSAGYVLQGKDGKVFTGTAPSVIQPTSLGKLSRMVGMRLEGITPGDYELILNLKDELNGKVLQVREPLKIGG
jgi:VWFA-related protein